MDADAARSVRGVVLAGGYPWNEATFDALAPRVLLQVGHQPLIAWALSWLAEADVRDVTVCANPATAEPISRFIQDAFPDLRTTVSVDATPRGPAGCVKDAVEADAASTYVVVDGAVLPTAPLRPLLDVHLDARPAATVIAHEDTARGGAPLRVPSGTYLVEGRALDAVPPRGFYDIKENLIPRLYAMGELVVAQILPGSCPRVLNSGTYLAVSHWLVDRIAAGPAPLGYASLGETVAHVSARIGVDAILTGPVIVGPGATILSGATVVGPAVIGPGTSVETGALVSRSVTWARAVVGRGAFVDRSVLADDSVVDAGATLVGAVRGGGRRARAPRAEPVTPQDVFPIRARSTS